MIGGGITGAETALELNAEGKKVTIVEMTDAFLANLVPLVRHILQRSMTIRNFVKKLRSYGLR